MKAKGLGVHFRRQFGLGPYIVDLYCHEKKLVIELDGLSHADETIQDRDAKKEAFLIENGYTVLRYTDTQVLDDIEFVVQDIQKHT